MMKKMVMITIVGLILVVGVTAYLNRGAVAEKEAIQEKAMILVKSNGEEIKTMDMESIEEIGGVEFDAHLKTDGKEAEVHKYVGVPLKNVFETCNVEVTETTQVIVKAVDGYTVALTGKEVLQDDNVYLAYKMDGKPLGKKEEGGKGPYQVIIREDQFSQRWCKFVVELDVQ